MSHPSEIQQIINEAKIVAGVKLDLANDEVAKHRAWVLETSGGEFHTEGRNNFLRTIAQNVEKLYRFVLTTISNRRRT